MIRLPELRATFLLLVSFLAMSFSPLAASSPSASVATARDRRIAIMGRFAFDDDGGTRLAFPGGVIRFVYRGPSPTLRFAASTEDCYFDLSCNGWAPVVIRLNKGGSEFTLPAGPAPTDGWLVELTRRTEAWQGVATFRGLHLPPGCELSTPPAWPERRLMVIGDSQTCGQFVERMPPENDATARTSNAARSFAWLLAKSLDAQVHLVSYGGKGFVRDWEGRTDSITAAQFFERALPDDPAAAWDHTRYGPDVIVVCLGQNDLNSLPLPDAAVFRAACERFVKRVREVHPTAAILLAESPMHRETPASDDAARRAFLRVAIDGVVALRRAAGDSRIAFAPLHHQPGTVHDSHPVAFQHEQISQELLGPARVLAGW